MDFHTACALPAGTATKQDHSCRDYIRDDDGGKGFAIRMTGHFTVSELELALACLKEADKEFAASLTPARRIPAAARALVEAAGRWAESLRGQMQTTAAKLLEDTINADVGEPLPKWATAALKGYSVTRAELAPVLDAALIEARKLL